MFIVRVCRRLIRTGACLIRGRGVIELRHQRAQPDISLVCDRCGIICSIMGPARLAAPGQAPEGELVDVIRRDTLEAVAANHGRFERQLGGKPGGNFLFTGRCTGLEIDHRDSTIAQLIDPVGPGGQGERACRARQLDPPPDFGVNLCHLLPTPAFGREEPSGDSPKSRPPESPDSG